jgi:16S rRNA (uracil1498-N3)-methyltransferase
VSERFYFDGPLGPGDVILTGSEAHHLSAVRRFAAGDMVTLFNGHGREFPAQVAEVAKKQVILQVTGVESPDRELGFPLHIAAALPKGDRGDFLVEKLTELGVTDFTPLITERGVVKATDAKAGKLHRAVIEASKQCGRNVLMRVHSPAEWLAWCSRQTGRRLLAHLGEAPAVYVATSAVEAAIVAIGPEGGFTGGEVGAGLAAGWELLSLGPRVLRVETAALAAAVILGNAPNRQLAIGNLNSRRA